MAHNNRTGKDRDLRTEEVGFLPTVVVPEAGEKGDREGFDNMPTREKKALLLPCFSDGSKPWQQTPPLHLLLLCPIPKTQTFNPAVVVEDIDNSV